MRRLIAPTVAIGLLFGTTSWEISPESESQAFRLSVEQVETPVLTTESVDTVRGYVKELGTTTVRTTTTIKPTTTAFSPKATTDQSKLEPLATEPLTTTTTVHERKASVSTASNQAVEYKQLNDQVKTEVISKLGDNLELVLAALALPDLPETAEGVMPEGKARDLWVDGQGRDYATIIVTADQECGSAFSIRDDEYDNYPGLVIGMDFLGKVSDISDRVKVNGPEMFDGTIKHAEGELTREVPLAEAPTYMVEANKLACDMYYEELNNNRSDNVKNFQES